MTCDVSRLIFDISGSAAAYAILAGVLAGFAFTAIAAVLPGTLPRRFGSGAAPAETSRPGNPSPVSRGADRHILVALFGAFLALIAATLEYAQLAGERGCSLVMGRAASEEMLSAVAFGFAILMLLYAVVLLIDHVGVGVGEHFRFLGAALAPPFGLYLIGRGSLAIAESPLRPPLGPNGFYRPQVSPFSRLVDNFVTWQPIVLGLVCVGMWIAGARLARRRERRVAEGLPSRAGMANGGHAGGEEAAGRTRHVAVTVLQFYPYAPLVLSLVAVLRSSALSTVNPGAHLSHAELWVWLGVCAGFFLVHTAVLAFVRAPEEEPALEPADAGLPLS